MQRFPCLVRRNGSYYVRVRVPKDLVVVLKRRELKRSLNTKDVRIARREYQQVYGELLRRITGAREKLNPVARRAASVGDEALRETVRAWFFRVWEQSQRDFDIPPSLSAPTREEMIGEAEQALESLAEGDGYLPAFAKRLLQHRGIVAPSEDDVRKMAGYLRRGMSEINRAIIEHYRDHRFHHAIGDPLFQGAISDQPLAGVLTVAEAIKKFEADPHRKKLSPKNRLGYLMPFRLLREIAGGDTSIMTVSREHAREIVVLVSKLPANAVKRFKDRPAREIVRLAEAQRLPAMAEGTAKNILRNLKAFFAWLNDEGYAPHNPFRKLAPLQERRHRDEGRSPWDEPSLVRFFSAPQYQAYREDKQNAARYWVPLIGLFHGARANEICQLELADVVTEDGIPAFRITAASERGSVKRVKTRSAERLIPVHPKILALGFMEFVESQRGAGHAELFPDVRMASTGYRSDNFSKFFGRFKRALGVTDRRMVFHSFRHSFNDAARVADIPPDIVAELAGWSKKSMREHYGRGHSIQRKRDEIARIAYPCLDAVLGGRAQSPNRKAELAAVEVELRPTTL